ncbi:MAG: hypothetical protein K8S00_11360, partial [Bacteroidales bacterium]|nr:hypothetical protein [Bacteroidales bacterium]
MKDLKKSLKRFGPLLGIILLISLGCKKEDNNESIPSTNPPVYENGEGEIGAIGGIITITDSTSPIKGAYVDIPEGALSEKVNIKISEAPAGIEFVMNPQMKLIKFEPEGLIFDKPIKIKIPYSNIVVTDKTYIFHYDDKSFEITQMPKISIDQTNKLVVGETNHFSYYTVWNQDVCIFQEMLKINNKIGLSLFIEDMKDIPTNPDYNNLNQIDNAWDAVLNGPSPLYMVFIADLYTENSFWQQPVSSLRLHIKRAITGVSGQKAQIFLYGGSTYFYETEALSEP